MSQTPSPTLRRKSITAMAFHTNSNTGISSNSPTVPTANTTPPHIPTSASASIGVINTPSTSYSPQPSPSAAGGRRASLNSSPPLQLTANPGRIHSLSGKSISESNSLDKSMSAPGGVPRPAPMMRTISQGAATAMNVMANAIIRPGSRSTVDSKQSNETSNMNTSTTGYLPNMSSFNMGNGGSIAALGHSGILSKPGSSPPTWKLDRTIMRPFFLSFINPETELDYQRFYLERNLSTWKRAVQGIFVVCTLLYLYGILAFPNLSDNWRELYAPNVKAANGNVKPAFICPTGWYCEDCDPNGFCGIYTWTTDLLFWATGVLFPQAVAYGLSVRLSRDVLAKWMQAISAFVAIASLTFGLITRYIVMEPRTSVYTSGLILIEFMFLTFIFMRFRFIYALFSVSTALIIYVALNVYRTFNGAVDGARSLLIVGIALLASSVVICMYNFEWEMTSRNQFIAALNLHKANQKLTNQLKVLQRSYGNRAADFDSPLEKAVMNLKSLMADPVTGQQHLIVLSQTVSLLSANNLLAPDLEGQEMKMDNEQEAWLFSEIARRKNRPRPNKRRGSLLAQNPINEGESLSSLSTNRRQPTIEQLPHQIHHDPSISSQMGASHPESVIRSSQIGVDDCGSESVTHSSLPLTKVSVGYESLQLADTQPSLSRKSVKAPATLENLPASRAIADILLNVPDYNFPIFDLATLTENHPLIAMGHHIFEERGLFTAFDLPKSKFTSFIIAIEDGYHKDLPYHNCLHAADVLHATAHFATLDPINKLLTNVELMAIFLGAIIHDHDHPGFSNNFLVAVNDSKAILYNDRAVLENHHLASSFAILNKESNNFLSNMPKAEYKILRETVVETVLATDLSQHFQLINAFKNKVASIDTYDPHETKEDRILLWKMIMKAADVSNATKETSLCKNWSQRILEEMCMQGDKEKLLSLPVSPFMDRETLNVPSSQTGFIDFVVAPLFDAFTKYVNAPHVIRGLEINRAYWQEEKERVTREKELKEKAAAAAAASMNEPWVRA